MSLISLMSLIPPVFSQLLGKLKEGSAIRSYYARTQTVYRRRALALWLLSYATLRFRRVGEMDGRTATEIKTLTVLRNHF